MKQHRAASRLALGLAGLLTICLFGSQAFAVPLVCGTTLTAIGGNGTFDMSALGSGVCVQAQDKLFGNFTFGNIPAGGTVAFSLNFVAGLEYHQIAFNSTYQTNTTYTGIGFQVDVIPGSNKIIVQLDADFTQTVGGPSTLTKQSIPAGSSNPFSLTKVGTVPTLCTSPLGGGECGERYFPGVTSLVVSESLVDMGTISSITDTVIEADVVPEPASLILLGTGLLGLAVVGRRFRK